MAKKIFVPFCISLLCLLPSVVLAQEAAPASNPPPKANAEVVVTGSRLHYGKCRDKDQECILHVAQQLAAQFPEQTLDYCAHEKMRLEQQNMLYHSLPGTRGDLDTRLPKELIFTCDYVRDEVKKVHQ